MAALLFMSLGIPMLAAGQDFLRSKRGVNNTYQRGDLNALDYRRLYRFQTTHEYFADWIAFRRSATGRLLRQWSRPSEEFFQFAHAKDSPAFAAAYNVDGSQGRERLLFAVNPTASDATIPIGDELVALAGEAGWRQLANEERFLAPRAHGVTEPVEPELFVPALGCRLWVSGP
jgi:pullulanase/glycogen debranching enzyme